MNKQQVTGRAEQAKGKAKEVVGKAVGNDRLKAEGQGDQMMGKTKAFAADTRDKIKKAIDKR